jgi:sodium transport system permease protein
MRGLWLVFKKEVLEFTKDRKTMFFTLALPIILYPLLFGVIAKMTSREEKQVQSSQTRVALIDASGVVKPLLEARPNDFKLIDVGYLGTDGEDEVQQPESVGEPTEMSAEEADAWAKDAIKNDKLEMLVTLQPSASQDMTEQQTVLVDVLYNKVENRGRVGMQRFRTALQELDKSTIQSRLRELKKFGASEQLAVPTEIKSRQIGGEELALAKMLGTMLPYFLMLMLFAGSMQLGVYVTAGERERGTLVTLLATGLPRHEIIWGKLTYVFVMGIVVSVINIAAMAFSMGVLRAGAHDVAAVGAGHEVLQATGIAAVVTPSVISLTLLLMIPLGLLFSTIIVLLGIQAKNSQEAGTSMMPFLLVVIFLSIFSMSPGIEKMGVLPYIPIVNISLAIRKLFSQPPVSLDYFITPDALDYFIALGMTLGLALVLTYVSTKLLNRESAIFKST